MTKLEFICDLIHGLSYQKQRSIYTILEKFDIKTSEELEIEKIQRKKASENLKRMRQSVDDFDIGKEKEEYYQEKYGPY